MQFRVLEITLSYFLYDTLYCALIERTLEMTLHHIATVSGLQVGVFSLVVRSLGCPWAVAVEEHNVTAELF